jgi:hypothetical protein
MPTEPAAQPRAPVNRRAFGLAEAVFDTLYLLAALGIGLSLLGGGGLRPLCAALALTLALGDSFHLAPRILMALTGRGAALTRALGVGKLVASLTMTAFYVLLWQVGLLLYRVPHASALTAGVYALAALRAALCLLPQNRWLAPVQPQRWAVIRNVPFVLLGAAAALLFALGRPYSPPVGPMWAAIAVSFACYLPVALLAGRNPRLGMLMLPKTAAYLWMLYMAAQLANA